MYSRGSSALISCIRVQEKKRRRILPIVVRESHAGAVANFRLRVPMVDAHRLVRCFVNVAAIARATRRAGVTFCSSLTGLPHGQTWRRVVIGGGRSASAHVCVICVISRADVTLRLAWWQLTRRSADVVYWLPFETRICRWKLAVKNNIRLAPHFITSWPQIFDLASVAMIYCEGNHQDSR